MCIICVEFQRTQDLVDVRRMIAAARREPSSIEPAHLDDVERRVRAAEQAEGETP